MCEFQCFYFCFDNFGDGALKGRDILRQGEALSFDE
jgi:hypothetical protein